MVAMNKVIIAGNLTRDPELRNAGQTPVATMGVAINRTWTGKDGQKQEEVTFVDVTVFGRQAEACSQYLTKGRPVLIEGRLKLDQWEDRESGAKRSKLHVIAEWVQFLGGRDGEGGGSGGGGGGRQQTFDRGGSGGGGRERSPGQGSGGGAARGGEEPNYDDIPF